MSEIKMKGLFKELNVQTERKFTIIYFSSQLNKNIKKKNILIIQNIRKVKNSINVKVTQLIQK